MKFLRHIVFLAFALLFGPARLWCRGYRARRLSVARHWLCRFMGDGRQGNLEKTWARRRVDFPARRIEDGFGSDRRQRRFHSWLRPWNHDGDYSGGKSDSGRCDHQYIRLLNGRSAGIKSVRDLKGKVIGITPGRDAAYARVVKLLGITAWMPVKM